MLPGDLLKKHFAIIFVLFFSTLATAATEDPFPDPDHFPVPAAYESNVQFWMRVYGEWDDSKMAIHDAQNMDIVFAIAEMPEENYLLRLAARTNLDDRVNSIRKILLDLANNPDAYKLSEEHARIYALYRNVQGADKFRVAAGNIRIQQGIKDRFRTGLAQMTRYLTNIKRVFREEGLPEEIAYLPLVESSFNNASLSKTRAAGIWQFMPGTARLYMKVNSDVDERLDPVIATQGAARYLKRSYQMFGTWPVALMSYNHGQQGISNAIRHVGSSSFMDIITQYNGRYFGFASRNFYAEFVAACRVMKQSDKYFGPIDSEKPILSDSIKLAQSLSMTALLFHTGLSREEIRIHNPALSSSVLFSKRNIPAGYQLRLPAGQFQDLAETVVRIRGSSRSTTVVASATPKKESSKKESSSSKSKKSSSSNSSARKAYVVRKGDTLFSISRKFATTVETIRRLNGLDHNHIVPGQKLYVASR